MDINLAFSPCPNDTFIFDALVHQKIDTEGLRFIPHLHDVEELNQAAAQNRYEVSKLSYFGYGFVRNQYQLLRAGSALGFGCGPMLISRQADILSDYQSKTEPKELPLVFVAGKFTTSHFLLCEAYPWLTRKQFVLFSDIEKLVLETPNSLGLIIHENRFTYQSKGLHKIADLGEWWEQNTQKPIPLGGIAALSSLGEELNAQISRLIRQSVQFAFQNPASSRAYIKSLSQELDDAVIQQHIDLYVNQYSVDLGEDGSEAVHFLLNRASYLGLIPAASTRIVG